MVMVHSLFIVRAKLNTYPAYAVIAFVYDTSIIEINGMIVMPRKLVGNIRAI